MIGLGFGRIGCFLNGCCYGEQCDITEVPPGLRWAADFPFGSNPYIDQLHDDQVKPRITPPDASDRAATQWPAGARRHAPPGVVD